MNQSVPENFWKHKPDELLSALKSQPSGLTEAEAAKRLSAIGTTRQRNPLVKDILLFLSQFKSPLVLLLVAAVILSAFLGEKTDVIIIMSILIFTGTLGFWQERNAGKAVEKLRAIITVKARVL